MRMTKIICTMGPACDDVDTLVRMIDAGMNVARFNMSHGEYDAMTKRFDLVNEAIAKSGKTVALLLDTKGPEIRVGTFSDGAVQLTAGQEYRLYSGFLSSLPVTVCRQKVIGKYIVDFLIPSAMLVIEVDGAQHYSEKGLENDRQRDAFLRSEGYSVLRYSNSDIMHNLDGVADDILNRLGML